MRVKSPRSMVIFSAVTTSLVHHVLAIIFLCSQPKMVWVDTPRIVTVMQYLHSLRYRSIYSGPIDTVGIDHFAVNGHLAIPSTILHPLPFPAIGIGIDDILHGGFRFSSHQIAPSP